MNEELMKKSWEHFGGVWPYDVKFHGSVGLGFFTSATEIIISENGIDWDKVTQQQFEAYGASLKTAWVPEIGQECEWFPCSEEGWIRAVILADIGDNEVVIKSNGVKTIVLNPANFRPLKTEREKFVEQALGIIEKRKNIGALFDEGARFNI